MASVLHHIIYNICTSDNSWCISDSTQLSTPAIIVSVVTVFACLAIVGFTVFIRKKLKPREENNGRVSCTKDLRTNVSRHLPTFKVNSLFCGVFVLLRCCLDFSVGVWAIVT